MIERALPILALVSALGCGVIGGVFFAFSSFVMRALARLPAEQGIAAMQSINVAVINPVFLGVFVGTAITSGAVIAAGLWRWHAAGAATLVGGGALYLVGTFLLTIAFHIPRNDALAALDPKSADAAARWAEYLGSWTMGNHVRAAAAILAAAALIVAYCRLRVSAG